MSLEYIAPTESIVAYLTDIGSVACMSAQVPNKMLKMNISAFTSWALILARCKSAYIWIDFNITW